MIRAALILLALAGPVAAQTCRATDATAALVAGANAPRAKAGAPPLTAAPALARAAAAQACDMARRRVLDHRGADGADVLARIRRAGCRPALAAENIAWGFPDAAAVLAGWMGSDAHRRNLVLPKARQAGAARAEGGGKVWWVMVFAAGC